jgi:hypothetical protein
MLVFSNSQRVTYVTHTLLRLNLKDMVKFSLYLTKHHAMKTYWGVEV